MVWNLQRPKQLSSGWIMTSWNLGLAIHCKVNKCTGKASLMSLSLASSSVCHALISSCCLCSCLFGYVCASSCTSLACHALSHQYILKGLAGKCNSESILGLESGHLVGVTVAFFLPTLILYSCLQSQVLHEIPILSLNYCPVLLPELVL